jgi:thymidine kinase
MSLEVILGSMYSGKSTELMRRVHRIKSIGMRCLVINHTNDTRVQGDFIQTHDGKKLTAVKTNNILLVGVRSYDAIAIDEGQFFSNLKTAVKLMLEKNKHVIVAGLSGDYQREKFGEILDLVPIADDVTYTRAICRLCAHPGRAASFTKRLSSEKNKISVNSEYIAVCRSCYEC